MLLFLSKSAKEGDELYYTVNYSQSVYVLKGEDLAATVKDPAMPLSKRIASLSLPQVRAEVKQAKVKIASGEVKALPKVR